MKNLAGMNGVQSDIECETELKAAGIKVERVPESYRREMGEVQTIIIGTLHGWTFERAWYYWVARGPGLPLEYAIPLYKEFGQDVRVDGHCGGVWPTWSGEIVVGMYHVDTQQGLDALAKVIVRSVEDAKERYPDMWGTKGQNAEE